MSEFTIIGLDIVKNAFNALAVASNHAPKLRGKLRRSQVSGIFRKQDACLVVMEAHSSAHYWAREFEATGYRVKLLPQQVRATVCAAC